MKASDLEHGMRVHAEAGADSESGVVLQIDLEEGRALVGWDQGIQSWTDADALEPEETES